MQLLQDDVFQTHGTEVIIHVHACDEYVMLTNCLLIKLYDDIKKSTITNKLLWYFQQIICLHTTHGNIIILNSGSPQSNLI